jgi:hypothetical protein
MEYYKLFLKSLRQGPWNPILSPYTYNWASFIQEWGFLDYSSYDDSPTVAPQLFGLGQHDKTQLLFLLKEA